MNTQKLHLKLNKLESQKLSIENEIIQIKKQINKLSSFSKQDKIKLFQSLFIGRDDVYATYWVSKDGLKKGYSPVAYTFRGKDYISISDNIIQKHLEGKIRMGTYAIIDYTMAKFLVLDLDKKSFIEDARAIKTICDDLSIAPYIELSKSGNGIHIWFFFEGLLKAIDVRKLGDLIIAKAMDIANGIDMKSYDRMFPNQDFVAPDMLGNLIALPLHFTSRKENKTVFIDIDTMQPIADQWQLLRNVKKISEINLSSVLQNNLINVGSYQDSLMPWEIKQEKPIKFPQSTKAMIYDALYIEKLKLSKELINKLKRFASFLNPQFYKLQNLRKSTFNTPRIVSLYDINERYIVLPRGLMEKIKQFFKTNNAKLIIEDKRFTNKIDKPNLTFTLREKQKIALNKIIKTNYSLFIAPPGFGKTIVASAIIEKRKVNTLILVHKTALLEQWITRLSEYFGIDKKSFGQLGKGKKALTANIDVAMLQSLRNRPNLIKKYSQIIIDEVHHIPAISFEIPLRNFCGKYIVGLSATPKRQDGMHPIMYMQCGDIVHEVQQEKDKQASNILRTITTEFESIQDSFTLILNEMVEDIDRNTLIINEILKLENRHILIMSERVWHLNILYRMLEDKNIKSTLLHGGLKQKAQKEALIEAQTSNIILSTSTFIGEGIDLAHLDTVIFTMPISFDGRMVQYLGRIGRRGQECLAIDFIDESHLMLKNSFTKRLKGYKKMGYRYQKELRDNLFYNLNK